jgi:hypothetical protein
MTQAFTASVANALVARHPALAALATRLTHAADLICACHQRDGLVLVCGNGGSAADSAHIVGELMKGFLLPRAPTDQQRACIASASCMPSRNISDCWWRRRRSAPGARMARGTLCTMVPKRMSVFSALRRLPSAVVYVQ